MYDLQKRRPTRQIHIGKVAIGGGAPISVQSMTNTKTTDTEATVAQIRALQAAGCDIVRLAVPDMEAAKNLGNILRQLGVCPASDENEVFIRLSFEDCAHRVSKRCSLKWTYFIVAIRIDRLRRTCACPWRRR